jgi:hypothetical protein
VSKRRLSTKNRQTIKGARRIKMGMEKVKEREKNGNEGTKKGIVSQFIKLRCCSVTSSDAAV